MNFTEFKQKLKQVSGVRCPWDLVTLLVFQGQWQAANTPVWVSATLRPRYFGSFGSGNIEASCPTGCAVHTSDWSTHFKGNLVRRSSSVSYPPVSGDFVWVGAIQPIKQKTRSKLLKHCQIYLNSWNAKRWGPASKVNTLQDLAALSTVEFCPPHTCST